MNSDLGSAYLPTGDKRITVVDNRPTKSVDVRGLIHGPQEMHELRTTPSVAAAVQASLESALPRLQGEDRVEGSVLTALCRIANNYTKASATFELRVETNFRIAGAVSTKTLISGIDKRDFPIGFSGADVPKECAEYFRTSLSDIGRQSRDHFDSLLPRRK